MFWRAPIVTLAFLICVGLTTVAEARRLALVIGNSDYQHASALINPANDSRDLAAAFTGLGYDVQLVEDATRAALLDALRDFRARSIGADHAVIYYAGHGVEIDRQNYVIPVDAELKADIDIEYEAVPLDLLVAATSGARNLQLVVLDACRDNPFLSRMTRTMSTRSVGRGLAVYEPDGNSLVAYSAREGTVALDGTGANSPYAKAFLTALDRPGLEIGQFFRQVRDLVINETNGRQEPFLYGSLSAEPVFLKVVDTAPAIAPPPSATPQDGASSDTLLSIDLAFWQSIRDSAEPTDFEDYISRFPKGQFLPLAQRRLTALKATPAPSAPRQATVPKAPETNVGSSALSGTQDAGLRAPPEPEAVELTRSEARDLQARLNILGFNAGGEDGLIGRKTRAAVARYKSARGLPGGSVINISMLSSLRAEVSDTRLETHREEARKAAAARATTTKTTTPQTTTTRKSTQTTTTTRPSGNLSGFAGKTYCRSKGGVVLNGRNLSDRPIWCITVLSVSSSRIRYRVTRRDQYGKPVNTSVLTQSGSGNRRYGPVRLAASGSGSLSANGGTFVASGIYK